MTVWSLHPFRWMKKHLPRGLLGRTSLIMILPVLMIQGITTFVFIDRHLSKTTDLLTENLVALVQLVVKHSDGTTLNDVPLKKIGRLFHVSIRSTPLDSMETDPNKFHGMIDASSQAQALSHQLAKVIKTPFFVEMRDEILHIHVETASHGFHFKTPMKQLYTKTTNLLFWWALLSTVFFLCIAFIFLRNQIRPLRALSHKVEAFGQGQSQAHVKPVGSMEVQQVTKAFNVMQRRIATFIKQRTEMLAGVSHDLRTILTRISLEVEMLPPPYDTRLLKEDIALMRGILSDYLAFAQGIDGEKRETVDLNTWIPTLQKRHSFTFQESKTPCFAHIQPQAMTRCLGNLLENALKYGGRACHLLIQTDEEKGTHEIFVEDDGPGIPEALRYTVFRPFFRIDTSRNFDTGGVGLGLAIARDIAQNHGGSLEITKGHQYNGACFLLRIPVYDLSKEPMSE